MAMIRYNSDRSQCEVELDDGTEFGPLDTSAGGILFLTTDNGAHYALVVSDDELETDEVYQLTPVGAEIEEDAELGSEEEEGEETAENGNHA